MTGSTGFLQIDQIILILRTYSRLPGAGRNEGNKLTGW
ncbi:hypothetical protein OP10G_4451 [Fimbriimonas ginsengisoli Gsoil 348]|uniref:Uncharacterized protein n=1 Tax=Fimbriimonas ginsengisoli Gsoil 348 TaxID=661478 RepID=A0A068NZ22_FIMGI|nr:hypothetical protein OP10G_4451 [Fimbriimonas ginsengisoli Gsoil 348]